MKELPVSAPSQEVHPEASPAGLDRELFGDLGMGSSFPVETTIISGDHKKTVQASSKEAIQKSAE